MLAAYEKHAKKVGEAINQFKKLKSSPEKGFISLKPKSTTHFFRKRKKTKKLDLLPFTEILSISKKDLVCEVEGLTSFKKLTEETFKLGLLPEVIPELKNITIGGTISSMGIESSSFLFGMVHNTVKEYDVITGTGQLITCSPTVNSDLYYMLPNSVGTLGYVTKAKVRLIEALPYVFVKLLRFEDIKTYTEELEKLCNEQKYDYIDSVIFSPNHFVIVVAEMRSELKNKSELKDFSVEVYWKYLKDKKNTEFFMDTLDFQFRWDYDVFWDLSNKGIFSKIIENSLFRKTVGRFALNSTFIIHKLGKYRDLILDTKLGKLIYKKDPLFEDILQDIGVDIKHFQSFFKWYEKELSIFPMWICPYKNLNKDIYPLVDFKGEFILDVGIYTGKLRPKGTDVHYYNKMIEEQVIKLGGHKAHYSNSYYTKEQFWKLYNKDKYELIKNKYDPENSFPSLYEKCVGEVTL